jgi:hypothetical protein
MPAGRIYPLLHTCRGNDIVSKITADTGTGPRERGSPSPPSAGPRLHSSRKLVLAFVIFLVVAAATTVWGFIYAMSGVGG